MRKLAVMVAMISMLTVAPNVTSAFTLIDLETQLLQVLLPKVAVMEESIAQNSSDIAQLADQNESILEQIQMMSSRECDEPIQLVEFEPRVLHENVKIESVYVDLTNSNKVKLHLKLDKGDPFGTERDVYVHKCMQEALGVALSIVQDPKKCRSKTHVVVGLDSYGDAVLIRISLGKKALIPEY